MKPKTTVRVMVWRGQNFRAMDWADFAEARGLRAYPLPRWLTDGREGSFGPYRVYLAKAQRGRR